MSELVRRRVLVTGRVQGVYFRQSTVREASVLGLAGWVRNLPDGQTVEAVFEGTRELVDAAVTWCAEGPRGAAVESVEVFEETPEGLVGFSLRY